MGEESQWQRGGSLARRMELILSCIARDGAETRQPHAELHVAIFVAEVQRCQLLLVTSVDIDTIGTATMLDDLRGQATMIVLGTDVEQGVAVLIAAVRVELMMQEHVQDVVLTVMARFGENHFDHIVVHLRRRGGEVHVFDVLDRVRVVVVRVEVRAVKFAFIIMISLLAIRCRVVLWIFRWILLANINGGLRVRGNAGVQILLRWNTWVGIRSVLVVSKAVLRRRGRQGLVPSSALVTAS